MLQAAAAALTLPAAFPASHIAGSKQGSLSTSSSAQIGVQVEDAGWRPSAGLLVMVVGLWLHSVILKLFSDLSDSVTVLPCTPPCFPFPSA